MTFLHRFLLFLTLFPLFSFTIENESSQFDALVAEMQKINKLK
jgi:hypothetical protein